MCQQENTIFCYAHFLSANFHELTRIIFAPPHCAQAVPPQGGQGACVRESVNIEKYDNQSAPKTWFALRTGSQTMILIKAESLVALAQGIALCYDIPWFHCPERAKAKNKYIHIWPRSWYHIPKAIFCQRITRINPNYCCPATLRVGGSPSRGSGGMREGIRGHVFISNT